MNEPSLIGLKLYKVSWYKDPFLSGILSALTLSLPLVVNNEFESASNLKCKGYNISLYF